MAKGRYFGLGAGLIVVGAAFMALNIWLLAKGHAVTAGGRPNGVLIVIGGSMLVAGVMVLLGF